MATITALDLITQSLKRLGVLSGIETPTADLAVDSLARLNDLIESWSTESLTLWEQVAVAGINLAVNPAPAYTIGPGGDFNVAIRPAWVNSVSWLLPGTPQIEYKLKALSKEEWENESYKALFSAQPTHYYYGAYWPTGYLQLWPRASVPPSLLLYMPTILQGPVTLVTVFDLPPGYSRALRDWLAIELAPEVGRPADGTLVQSAVDAKAQLQRTNFRPQELSLPPEIATGWTGRTAFDWRTGD